MDKRAATHVPLHPLLAGRWSPRGFDATYAITPEQLTALLEAARWAPSANNSQPWRFLVARRDEPAFAALFGALAPGNQLWAGAASALILVLAQTVAPDQAVRPYALYDTGQAVANLVAQAEHEGLSVHQMGGFDQETAERRFALPADLQPVVVLAVGRRDAAAVLPEALAERERAPRARRPIEELVIDQPVAA